MRLNCKKFDNAYDRCWVYVPKSRHLEKFENVTVDYNKSTGYLYISDNETNEQLAMFYVIEED